MKGLLRMHTYTYLVIHSEVDLLENVIYQKLVYIWQKKTVVKKKMTSFPGICILVGIIGNKTKILLL